MDAEEIIHILLFKSVYDKYRRPLCAATIERKSGVCFDLEIKDDIIVKPDLQRNRFAMVIKTNDGRVCNLSMTCADLEILSPNINNFYCISVISRKRWIVLQFKTKKKRNLFTAQPQDIQEGYAAHIFIKNKKK